MAKNGLDISNIQAVLRNVNNRTGWSLCIGAGTSVPVVPDWITLVEKIIQNNCDSKDKIDINTYTRMGFSADAMIQAVRNKLKVNDEEFVQILSREVFAQIRNTVSETEWKSFIKIHESKDLIGIREKEWEDFERIINKLLKNTSACKLAEVVAEAIKSQIAPTSILTFNGEAIFLALLSYYTWMDRKDNKHKFDRINNGMAVRHVNRIPYIHCHGLLPVDGVKKKKGYNSTDKLVFLEEEYLQLANTPISWQSINFIERCMNSKMVFVGVSLTDANMRRWLSFIHSNKMKEFMANGIECRDATEHFWINKKPNSEIEKTWYEETVSHLGVRLVWIDEWDQVGEVLRKMLGMLA